MNGSRKIKNEKEVSEDSQENVGLTEGASWL
jgi:hypothetical protein